MAMCPLVRSSSGMCHFLISSAVGGIYLRSQVKVTWKIHHQMVNGLGTLLIVGVEPFFWNKKKTTTCRLVPEITLTVCSSNHTFFSGHCLVVVSTYLCSHGHKLTFPSTSPIFSIIPRSKISSFIQSVRSTRSIRYQKIGLRASSNSTRQSSHIKGLYPHFLSMGKSALWSLDRCSIRFLGNIKR